MAATLTPEEVASPIMVDLVRRESAIYVGPCLVQSPGGWCRAGPTWIIPGLLWMTFGPGLGRWGTTRGLAQLASDTDASPTWHAAAWTTSQNPNLVLPILPRALEAEYMQPVRDGLDAVAELTS